MNTNNEDGPPPYNDIVPPSAPPAFHLEQVPTDSTSINGTDDEEYFHEQGNFMKFYCITIFQKMMEKKWWILLIFALVTMLGLVIGLPIRFATPSFDSLPPNTTANVTTITTDVITTMTTTTTTTSTTTTTTTTTTSEYIGKAVLVLSTASSTNIPMLIRLNGSLLLKSIHNKLYLSKVMFR